MNIQYILKVKEDDEEYNDKVLIALHTILDKHGHEPRRAADDVLMFDADVEKLKCKKNWNIERLVTRWWLDMTNEDMEMKPGAKQILINRVTKFIESL